MSIETDNSKWEMGDSFIRLDEVCGQLMSDLGTDDEWYPIESEDGIVALTHPNNVPRIVNAVNMFADLVAALQSAHQMIEQQEKDVDYYISDEALAKRESIETLINKAMNWK